LVSVLAFLDQHDGELDADLTAFLIAAHHGKVRMGLRALPEEKADPANARIARGVQDGDQLPEVACGEEISKAIRLDLGLMEMGEDANGRPSWGARTQTLLGEFGPFRLAYLEALLRMADWRASKAERRGEFDDE
jgi:CRISPR-associated endonuclease/helicase Cas3